MMYEIMSSNFPAAQNLAPKYLLINIAGLTRINPRQAPLMSDKDDAYVTIFQRTQNPLGGEGGRLANIRPS